MKLDIVQVEKDGVGGKNWIWKEWVEEDNRGLSCELATDLFGNRK